jgi:hypothetical protein
MKDPRNEHEASRLIQDSGFGRVGKGEPLEWSRPHRAADCFEDDSDSSMRGAGVAFAAAGIAGAVLVVVFAPSIVEFLLSFSVIPR